MFRPNKEFSKLYFSGWNLKFLQIQEVRNAQLVLRANKQLRANAETRILWPLQKLID